MEDRGLEQSQESPGNPTDFNSAARIPARYEADSEKYIAFLSPEFGRLVSIFEQATDYERLAILKAAESIVSEPEAKPQGPQSNGVNASRKHPNVQAGRRQSETGQTPLKGS